LNIKGENMRILFCSNPLNSKEVDPDYKSEYLAAKKVGLSIDLINFEDIIENNPQKAVKKIASSEVEEIGIYRGWMLSPANYEKLYNELLLKGIRLINNPMNYKHCHYLPESYSKIMDYTPKSTWIEKEALNTSFENLYELTKSFGHNPVILKDYVKSCKHQWNDACYIPDAADKENLNRVVRNFIELRGEDFEGGIIIREFVNLEFLTEHPKSNMPLSKEFRLFFLNHNLIQIFYYWDEGEFDYELPSNDEIKELLNLSQTIESQFFTMDIAKTLDGKWIIVELGDGQVSGLPYNANLDNFYSGILIQKL
jgi:hypothetical protein